MKRSSGSYKSIFDSPPKVMVVAEIGNNHEGRFDVAQELVRKAAECGADGVKFQTFRTKGFVSESDPVRFGRLESFELSLDQFEQLACLARSLGLIFITTPLDLECIPKLCTFVDIFKISSGDNNFFPLLSTLASINKPKILSTGIASLKEIVKCVAYIEQESLKTLTTLDLAILHCVSCYPVPPSDVNLLVIELLRGKFNYPIGYSDHCIGIEACILAVSLGARIIEKHFTLSHNFSDFRDHQLSADPPEMRELVHRIRYAELLLGKREKSIRPCEMELIKNVRRSAHAAQNLRAGHVIIPEDIIFLRPGDGIQPGEEARILGRKTRREISRGSMFVDDDVV